MLNDIAKRWEPSGMLEELNDEQANELASVFEEIAIYLISLEKEGPIFGFIFPAIRRIYVGINKIGKFSFIVNSVVLFWDLNEKLNIFRQKYPELFGMSGMDAEAEFVHSYCEEYINDLKKRGII